MNKVFEKVYSAGATVYSKFNSLSQAEQARSKAPKVITRGMPEILREAAAQGAVLLENNGVLPLEKDSRVALFGRVQNDWFYTGYGSGGDVNKPYAVNLLKGVRGCDDIRLNEAVAKTYEDWCAKNPVDHGVWGQWPRFYPEMPLTKRIVALDKREEDIA
ncbi:MAG: hypothetical protein IJ303_06140, partial [Clostridia bacterium]|nr:hypothetical protein [Clostridia bacterium]